MPTLQPANCDSDLETIEHLRELVQAIDKRARHFERTGEAEIVRDAAALRKKAIQRSEELTRVPH